MKKTKILIILFALITFIYPSQTIFGEETTTSGAEGADYSVKAVLPDNQLDRGKSFYDLRMTPGQKETIQLQVNNYSDKEQTYNISVNTAQTTGNVTIDYGVKEDPDKSVNNLPISQYVSYPESIKIPAKKAGLVSIEINAPKEKWDGILLGGIQVKKDFSEEKEESDQAIFSEYAYVIGLMLSQNDTKVEPDLTYEGIEAKSIARNAGLIATLKNPQPMNVSNVHFVGKIYKEGEKEPVITREVKDGGIAPDSTIDVQLFNGEAGQTKPLEAGKYHLEIAVDDKENHHWTFTDDFEITKEAAEKVNNKVFTVKKEQNYLLYFVIGILILLILILFIFLAKNKKKKEEKEK